MPNSTNISSHPCHRLSAHQFSPTPMYTLPAFSLLLLYFALYSRGKPQHHIHIHTDRLGQVRAYITWILLSSVYISHLYTYIDYPIFKYSALKYRALTFLYYSLCSMYLPPHLTPRTSVTPISIPYVTYIYYLLYHLFFPLRRPKRWC